MISDSDIYFDNINVLEDAVNDDAKFPVVKNNKMKKCCLSFLEMTKLFICYVKINVSRKENKTE